MSIEIYKIEEYKIITIFARFKSYNKFEEIKKLKRILNLFLKNNRLIKELNKRKSTSDKDNIIKIF